MASGGNGYHCLLSWSSKRFGVPLYMDWCCPGQVFSGDSSCPPSMMAKDNWHPSPVSGTQKETGSIVATGGSEQWGEGNGTLHFSPKWVFKSVTEEQENGEQTVYQKCLVLAQIPDASHKTTSQCIGRLLGQLW